jgi:molybdopterin-guanine dinucleotide biosynthesis protein A
MNAPLYGLVLAGGRSSRMGSDKAALAYGGRTQLERAMALLSPHVQHAYVSVRREQSADPVRARFTQIADELQDVGPIAGVLAAQARHPQAAWLVLACDLPFLDAHTLTHLLAARDSAAVATAYRSSHDGLPEPLCAIYEPRSREMLAQYVAQGRHCPRKFLRSHDVRLLDEPNPRALDNINTPQEYAAANSQLKQGAS